MVPLARSPERTRARWWAGYDGWEVRWQLWSESARRDPTITRLTPQEMRRLPDVVGYAERRGLQLYDILAYSALADGNDGRLRLVALFPGHPYEVHPDMLCLDGPRESKHRNPPFEDGVFGKSAELCLYFRNDPHERRWAPEHGLLGLFDLGRVHLANEHHWRRTGRWPGEDAPHGATTPARPRPELALESISPRNTALLYYGAPTTLGAESRKDVAA